VTKDEAKVIYGDRQRAYMLAFKEAAGQAVLMDLATFCRAAETCVVPGDRDRTYVLEGRREVYLRIREHLDLTVDQLVEKYTTPAKGAYGDELP
jgi:hypothetical protein